MNGKPSNSLVVVRHHIRRFISNFKIPMFVSLLYFLHLPHKTGPKTKGKKFVPYTRFHEKTSESFVMVNTLIFFNIFLKFRLVLLLFLLVFASVETS